MSEKKRFNSRAKGHNFERKVARDLRRIFDGDLAYEIEKAPKKKQIELLKKSRVHRGRQAEGASEGDVHIDGNPLWIECQCARHIDPEGKLKQAETDIEQSGSEKQAVAVCHETGSHEDIAIMRLSTLMFMMFIDGWSGLSVRIRYEDFLTLLGSVKC